VSSNTRFKIEKGAGEQRVEAAMLFSSSDNSTANMVAAARCIPLD